MMTRLRRLILRTVLFAGVIVLGFAAPAGAVESGGVGGRPANPDPKNSRTSSIFIYSLKQGESRNDAVTIFNNTKSKKTIAVYATDSAVSSGGSFACRQRVDDRNGVGKWIAVTDGQVTLDPNTSRNIPFAVTVPNDAPAGEQDGCIAIEDVSQTPTDTGNGVTISTRSAIRVAVTVPGTISKGITFLNLAAKLNGTKYAIASSLRNNGNVSIDTDLLIQIKSLVGGLSIGDTGGMFPVLPNVQTDLNFDVDRPFFGGFYNLVASAKYNDSQTAALGTGDKTTEVTKTVLVFIPPTLGGAVVELVFVAILGAVAYVVYRRRRDRKIWQGHAEAYVVKKGDTVQTVATAHNLSWKELAHHNKIKAPYQIDPGQTIQVLTTRKAPKRKTNVSDQP